MTRCHPTTCQEVRKRRKREKERERFFLNQRRNSVLELQIKCYQCAIRNWPCPSWLSIDHSLALEIFNKSWEVCSVDAASSWDTQTICDYWMTIHNTSNQRKNVSFVWQLILKPSKHKYTYLPTTGMSSIIQKLSWLILI